MSETLTGAPARNYVGGEWREAASGETYEKRNPCRPSEVTGVYPASDAADARAAIEAAREAFPSWAALPAAQRAGFFAKAAAAIEARAEQVALDMTAEMGKPVREARLETLRAATILRYAAGEAWRPIGEQYEPSVADQRLFTLRRPLGVVGLITPWNFPIAIPVWKLAPALIYGNTVVLKLGYEAPRTGLHVAECFAEAGLPAGVLNVLTGSGSKAGAEIVRNPAVRALSFTGSVEGGKSGREQATARDCRVQLELGGHNPVIAPTVFEGLADDAELSCEEVFGPVTSLYRYSTLDEAIERANAVRFGLTASIFTRDLREAQRFTSEIGAGIIHVNSQTAGADVHVPFGGIKGSGWGPHEQGRAAIDFYTELVTVYQDAPIG